MEYWVDEYSPPMPKVKKPKDSKIKEDAIKKIMTFAVYGAQFHAIQEGGNVLDAAEEVVQLFKDAGLIK